MKRMKGWKITGMLLIVTALVCFVRCAVIVMDTGGDMSSFIRDCTGEQKPQKRKNNDPG